MAHTNEKIKLKLTLTCETYLNPNWYENGMPIEDMINHLKEELESSPSAIVDILGEEYGLFSVQLDKIT